MKPSDLALNAVLAMAGENVSDDGPEVEFGPWMAKRRHGRVELRQVLDGDPAHRVSADDRRLTFMALRRAGYDVNVTHSGLVFVVTPKWHHPAARWLMPALWLVLGLVIGYGWCYAQVKENPSAWVPRETMERER